MKIEQSKLVAELRELSLKHLELVQGLMSLNHDQLVQRPHENAWNALECIEHLNRYGDFYLPECESRLLTAKIKAQNPIFRSSWLGEYFAQSMWPKEGFKPIKTFAVMNPSQQDLDLSTLEKFESQLKAWLGFLDRSQDYDWRKIKTGISISSLIKLRLGDTLRVVLYHHERHLRQAYRAARLA